MAAAIVMFSAGGLLVGDSVRRAGVSEIEFQRNNLFAACLTRVMALWLGLFFLAIGVGLVLLVVLTNVDLAWLRLLFKRH